MFKEGQRVRIISTNEIGTVTEVDRGYSKNQTSGMRFNDKREYLYEVSLDNKSIITVPEDSLEALLI